MTEVAGGGGGERELDFGGDAAGYEAWRRERERVAARAPELWGSSVGRRLRVTLGPLDRDIEGRLLLAEPPPVEGATLHGEAAHGRDRIPKR